MQRYKVTIAYDGTDYFGWQIQPNNVSVQGTIENALFKLSGERIKVHGSGRTDQGVHARAQAAHFDIDKSFTEKALTRAMNAVLPEDIRILNSQKVSRTFHARKDAKNKEYRYFIWNNEVMPPCLRKYRTHIRTALDIDAMQEAAASLVGLHDFSSFCSKRYAEEEDFVRNLLTLNVKKKGNEIVVTARSEGFLYKMVRSITGYLLNVGKGKVRPAQTSKVLAGRKRTQHVQTARPEGLFLWKVTY